MPHVSDEPASLHRIVQYAQVVREESNPVSVPITSDLFGKRVNQCLEPTAPEYLAVPSETIRAAKIADLHQNTEQVLDRLD